MVTPHPGSVTHYTYDKLGRLIKTASPIDAANSKVVKYYYDLVSSRHRFRKSKSIGDVPTTYVWDGDQLVLEITGDTVRKYIRGLTLVACVTGNAPVYYQYDGHGSVVQLTDATGAVIKNYDYDAFGNHIVQSYDDANPFRYSGEYFDDETDLYYLRARYYWPSLGQFTQEDPVRYSTNWYAYCNNNPVMFVDPLGLIPTAMEAALMAEHIYDATEDDRDVLLGKGFGGWMLDYIISGDEGLCIGVYYREIGGITEYSLVNKGTESWGDWVNNFQQPFGASTDMADSIRRAREFVNKYEGHEITMIGHSKGGAEAVANAVATNTNCIVFNPATAFLSAYDLTTDNYTADMEVYVVKGELLNAVEGWFSRPIDNLTPLKQQYPTWGILPWGVRLYNSYRNHGMKAVIWGLNNRGGLL